MKTFRWILRFHLHLQTFLLKEPFFGGITRIFVEAATNAGDSAEKGYTCVKVRCTLSEPSPSL